MTLNAAIVGLGWWGKVLVDSVQGKSSAIRFTRAVTRTGGAGEDVARRLGLKTVADYEEVLADQEVEAVVLATPHRMHVDQIVEAAKAGKPVFTEKPLSLELTEAMRAVQAIRDAGLILGIGTDKRFLANVLELTRLVRSGTLGDLLHLEGQYSNNFSSIGVSGSWRDIEQESPGCGMQGPGLHVLDGLINLAGPVARVDARSYRFKRPPRPVDTVAVLAEFECGATGLISTVRAVPDYFRLQVIGTKGHAEVRGFGSLHVHLLGAEPTVTNFDPTLAVGPLLEAFALAVVGERPFPVTTDSMLDTVGAFEAIIRSLDFKKSLGVINHRDVRVEAGRETVHH
jgi:predicted dehydrogenase